MNTQSPLNKPALSSCLRLLACCAALGLAPSAYAVCVATPTVACLADQPIQSTSIVKPNVMFILDNSGSMDWDIMSQDSGTSGTVNTSKYCRENFQYNTVYYDPTFDYTTAVPKNEFNVSMGSQSFSAAKTNPFGSVSTINLGVDFCATGATTACGTGASTTTTNKQTAFYYEYTGPGLPGTACLADGNYTKRRLSTTETTTIVVSGSSSTSVSSIKVNGVELMSASTSASSTDSTVASRIAAKISLGGFTATVSGTTVTITGPTSAANFIPVIVKSGSMTLTTDVFPDTTPAKLTNFANWYSYNRTRILMMKSGMSTAFSTIDDKIRVGFHTINNPSAGTSAGRSLNIDDFAATQKNNWYTALWSIAPSGGTPLRDALARAGNYYSNSGTRTGLSTTVDPVQYSCQKNFTILSTDGYWNGTGPTVGDMDRTVPASMPVKAGASAYAAADTGLTEGTDFPRPYRDTTANSNSLADVAMYYWVRDLRTSGSVSANNVPVSASDPAYWQHMNTYTIGLGVDGTLSYPSDLTGLTSGTKNWPTVIAVEGDRITTAEKVAPVDDLWHAAVNGRGQYYKATDPTSLANSLNAALRAVTDVPAYAVGPASSTNDFKSPGESDYTTYVTSYRIINWSGDVKKYALDRATGLQTGAALWSAAKQLDSKVNPGLTSTVSPTAYTTRNIVTRTEAGVAVDFTYPTLSATQKTALCYKVSPGTGTCVAADASLVNYLRGDATYEGVYGVGASRFRDRHDASEITYFKRDLFGSIINAQAAYVAVEGEIYQDAGYDAFKTASKTRAPTLYIAANDGMVHALDAATGNELWAYVPSFVIPTATDENGKEKGLRALSYQDSGAPAFNHHFYVDGPLEVGAVDFNRTAPLPGAAVPEVWKNILVGGLGKGGRGYYALDVTAPATSLDDARTKVLWEFPSAADGTHAAVIAGGQMGYSYGRPKIAKTYAYGWVVMLPSGYNNTDGYGHVFVLNAKTGALLETLTTTTPTAGLAHIEFLAKSNNKYALQAYGGDLNGSVWRFDFGLTPLSPRVSQIFSSSSSTPITTAVNVSIDGNNGDRWVFFGTGQYLDVPDRATTGTQYLVALRDGTLTGPRNPVPSPALLSGLAVVSNLLIGVTSAPLGWQYALPTSGERIALQPEADLRTVLFASLIPTTDPCSPGVSGNAYGLEYSSGKTRLMDGTGLVPKIFFPGGISSIGFVQGGKGPGTSGKVLAKFCSADGSCIGAPVDNRKLFSGTRHVGWRELLNEY